MTNHGKQQHRSMQQAQSIEIIYQLQAQSIEKIIYQLSLSGLSFALVSLCRCDFAKTKTGNG